MLITSNSLTTNYSTTTSKVRILLSRLLEINETIVCALQPFVPKKLFRAISRFVIGADKRTDRERSGIKCA